MSIGKTAAQVAHGIQKLMIEYYEKFHNKSQVLSDPKSFNIAENMKQWMDGRFTKIVLGAADKEWNKVKEQFYSLNQGIPCILITDAGFTEIEPGSETVVILWPMRKSETVHTIIKRLQLLK